MPKSKSILLGDYFDNIISSQIKNEKISSEREVIEVDLRMLKEESKKIELIKELEKGEKSGFIKNFDRKTFIKDLNKKYTNSKS